jgi:uncharacterized protein YbaP (TraB family)
LLPAAALVLGPVRLTAPTLAAEAAAAADDGRHVFWRLDKAAGGHLFLLGSLHFGDERLYPLPAAVEEAYREATVVVFETDLRQTMQPGFGELMRARAELPPPATLADLIPAAAIEAFRTVARELGVEPQYLERFRAWYCANQLMSLALRRAGVDPRRGIDQVFCARAVGDSKLIETLETPAFQVELFAGLEEEQAAALLTESLGEVAQVRTFVERMLAAYVQGDLQALEDLVTASFDGVPDLRRRFLSDRNAAWMPALEALARRAGSQFVVVGTGHLLGDDGVIARLRLSGHRVTRL